MPEGWIKLDRKLLKNPIVTNLELVGLLSNLLLRANHKEKSFFLGQEKVTVLPGQFISSQAKLAIEFGVSRSKIIRLLKVLVDEKIVDTKGYSKYTVFTLLNWNKYQVERTASEQQSIQPANTKGYTNKNVKKEKKKIYIDQFDNFWNLYPNKKGKKKSQELYDKKITSQELVEELQKGTAGYIADHEARTLKGSFVPERQHASTFLSKETRRDYLDQEEPTALELYDDYMKRYPDNYEYARKLVDKYGQERYTEMKQLARDRRNKENSILTPNE